MAKVTVTANEDFFDRGNQTKRVKGQEFLLKDDYAKTLGKQVTVKKGSTGPKDMSMDSIKSEDTGQPVKKPAAPKKTASKTAKKSK